jgi:membrane protease YdiL (CAAX protease family)
LGDPRRVLRWAIVFYGALAGAALAWNGWTGHPQLFRDADAAAAGVRWGRDVAAGLASAAAAIAVSRALTTRTRWGAALARELADALGPLSLRECAALALLSGYAEEAFFRGALQPRVGWIAASLVFGLAHFAPRRALLPWTGFALAAGFGLGALYEWTGNLAAPVVAHAVVNAVNLWLLCGMRGRVSA